MNLNKTAQIASQMETVHFTAYPYDDYTLFLFYKHDPLLDTWLWDEDKLTAEEALRKYPLDKFKWESFYED